MRAGGALRAWRQRRARAPPRVPWRCDALSSAALRLFEAAPAFQRRDPAVEPDILPPFLDHATGIGHRGAVAAKQPPNDLETHREADMAQIHRDLPRQRCALRAARAA